MSLRFSHASGIAGRIGGITLIILAVTSLLAAVGQLDGNITPETKKYILEPMFALGLVNRPPSKKDDGVQGHLNSNANHNVDTASVMIPAGAEIIEPPHVVFDSDPPSCNAKVDVGAPQSKIGPFGATYYTASGTAVGCPGNADSTAIWHIHTEYIDLGRPLDLTTGGRIAVGGIFLWGFIWTFGLPYKLILKSKPRMNV